MPEASKQRVAYIDWLRGLACVLMFQTHCYDSWLSGTARHSMFFGWSQLGGTLPAPLFLFIAGISFALVTDRLRR
ncbi:MAG: heparan-alpha-glucosaminide N-acetyltransferase domain-containing protein, partial [Candidatus Acidiferrales bacterium]